MEEEDFEGTLVLEKMAEIGKLDEFFEAIDSDNFTGAVKLMRCANVDTEAIEIVIRKMKEADGKP